MPTLRVTDVTDYKDMWQAGDIPLLGLGPYPDDLPMCRIASIPLEIVFPQPGRLDLTPVEGGIGQGVASNAIALRPCCNWPSLI
jgi:hypothetical protein